MKKTDPTVKRETLYIAYSVIIFSVLIQAVYLIINRWDYTVLLGNILSGSVSVLNFFLMGRTIQSATEKDQKGAKSTMKASQSLRLFMMFIALVLGVVLPCFDTVTSIIPIFIPRIAIMLRPIFDKDKTKQ